MADDAVAPPPSSPSLDPEPLPLCASEDLAERGHALGFDVLEHGRPVRAFALRFEGADGLFEVLGIGFDGVHEQAYFDGFDDPAPRPAPALGADTDAILSELGYDAARIAALREESAL